MSLANLIRKRERQRIATATPAIRATDSVEPIPSVAKIATVAVANPQSAAANQTRVADQGDDRRYCTDCANLAKREQRCLAALRGKAPEGAGRDYHPSLDLPRRCERYWLKQT